MGQGVTKRQEDEAVRWVEEPIHWARTFGGAQFDPWSGQERFWVEYGKLLGAKMKRYKGVPMTDEEQRYAKKIGISIMAGQGVGKGATISLCGLHYLFALQAYRPKVVCTAPAGPQLHSSLWPEFGAWIQRNPILGEIFEKQSNRIFLKEDGKRGEASRIEPRTVQPHANPDELKVVLAGIHALGVMYQIDEASGVQDAVMEPIEGGMTDPLSMAIVIFNPTKRSGFAMETHQRNREMWVCLHWDGEDLRREKLEKPARFGWFNEDAQVQLAKKYGKDSDFYRVRVKGLPPNQSSNTLISYEAVMDAAEREVVPLPGDPLVIAVDAGGCNGGDPSVIVVMRGRKLMSLKQIEYQNTTQLAQSVAWELKQELMNLGDEQECAIGVDYIGVGQGVYDHLVNVQQIPRCYPINVSERALDPQRFHRLRDQIWWEAREAFMEAKTPCIAYPDDMGRPVIDDELVAELTSIRWAPVEGKIKVQGKGSSSGIPDVPPLTKSPNKADAYIMALWLLNHHCSIMPLAARLHRLKRQRGVSWRVA